MQATQILMDEHRVIERVLTALQVTAGRVSRGEEMQPAQGGPIGVMLAENGQGRHFTRGLKDAAEKWEAGDLSARAAVVQNALFYVALLRQHIQKEYNVLFPMAELLIPPDRQKKITADFERIDDEETGKGMHEKYLALAEVLERESRKQI